MINGKIKEWHLDQALLQKIAANGSIDIATILEDYLKKTDIITREQLEPTLFDDVTDNIQDLQDALNAYRMKDTAITLEDIDSVFSNLLNTLQERLSAIESSISGSINIEAFINQAIAEQLGLSIDNAVEAALGEAVDNAIDAKIDELLESEEDLRLQNKIDESVQNVVQSQEFIDDIRDTVFNSAANTFITKDQLASTEEISNLQSAIDDLNSRMDDSQGEDDETEIIVTEDNLDEELAEKINSAYSNSESLSNRDFIEKKDGDPGQILIYNQYGDLDVSDILLQLNIVTNNAELNEQEAALAAEIYDASTMARYYIDRDKWNTDLYRNKRMETVPEIPEPEVINVTIRTNSAAKVFDETELTDQNYTITGWPEDTTDTISVVVTGSQIDIGESENSCEYEIVKNDIPTKYEYQIDIISGTLSVVETEEELEELLNPTTDTEPDDTSSNDDLDSQDNLDDNTSDDTNEDNGSDDNNSDNPDTNEEPNNSEDSDGPVKPEDPEEPEEPNEPGTPEEPVTPITELEYADFNLATENLQTTGITITIDNGIVSGTNESLIDTAFVCFGFYGTRIKLYTTITTPAEPTRESIKDYTVILDAKEQYNEQYYMGQECENACFLCVEGLSEGAHRIEFTIPADAEFKIDAKVSLDNEHAGLLQAEHIKLKDFYNGDIFNTGDYVTEPEYEELKSENVSAITVNDYASETIDLNAISRRLLYATNSGILYYCYDSSIFALTNRSSGEQSGSIDPDDLNRLETQLQAYVDNKFAQFVDADSTPF